MSANKCLIVFLLSSCLLALVAAGRITPDLKEFRTLSRHERSPQHGSVSVDVAKDQFGRHAGLEYNHNLYTSRDGQGSIDAYAKANRNFDYNHNDFQGGIQGKWRF